jgi:hypothetical protein
VRVAAAYALPAIAQRYADLYSRSHARALEDGPAHRDAAPCAG